MDKTPCQQPQVQENYPYNNIFKYDSNLSRPETIKIMHFKTQSPIRYNNPSPTVKVDNVLIVRKIKETNTPLKRSGDATQSH